MGCDIREPYVLKAMGTAYRQVVTSKGYILKDERQEIADRIVADAAAGETDIERLVAHAIVGRA